MREQTTMKITEIGKHLVVPLDACIPYCLYLTVFKTQHNIYLLNKVIFLLSRHKLFLLVHMIILLKSISYLCDDKAVSHERFNLNINKFNFHLNM